MILDKINSPTDLKKLNIEELELLSREIRSFIIEVVSNKGGHLASSLGAVELCIALHYCLNAPGDDIIFDVGHQTYAHKIITARKDAFKHLREYQGISGFPNYKESVYDTYTSGHASTAVSWAQGIAQAKKLTSDTSKTVAIIGDGSLTGGMCFEALNNCGHDNSDVLVVFNHNEMSISRSVGALSKHFTKIISAPIYNRIKDELESFLRHFSLGKRVAHQARKFEEAMKSLIVPGIFFEELGFRYFGPVDGHNLGALLPTLKNVISLNGPRILHVVTQKGKGYVFSEENPEDFHSACPFSIGEGKPLKASAESFTDVFSKKITSLAEKDKKIVAITAAMPKGTGLAAFQKRFPNRFFDVGIAEGHAVGFASGLAKKGLKPVVAIYSTFLQRSLDQIIHDIALQNAAVVFCLDRAGVVGEDGPTHHGVFDIGYLRLIPNMVCMAPKDKEEFQDMLEFSLSLNSAVSIRYPKVASYSIKRNQDICLGKSEVICEGEDICIIALGSMVKVAYECALSLREGGLRVQLINARFIKPLDEDLLKNLADNFKFIITVEEGNLDCGFGSAVLEFYQERSLLNKVKIFRAGFPCEFIPVNTRGELLKMHGLDTAGLVEKIKSLAKQEALWPK